MYLGVTELNRDQLEELRESYFWDLCNRDGDAPKWFEDCFTPSQVPDAAILDHFAGILFTNDDFFCTCGQ